MIIFLIIIHVSPRIKIIHLSFHFVTILGKNLEYLTLLLQNTGYCAKKLEKAFKLHTLEMRPSPKHTSCLHYRGTKI